MKKREKEKEHVMVVETWRLRRSRVSHEFWPAIGPNASDAVEALTSTTMSASFMPRSEAETDYHHKQIIPYFLVRCGGRYLVAQRTNKGTEERLHERWLAGFGGHIRAGDVWGKTMDEWLIRERDEELSFDEAPDPPKLLGYINDDSDDVGRVHFGIVYLIEAKSRDVTIRETDKLSAVGWFTPKEVLEQGGDRLESWTRFVMEYLAKHEAGDVVGSNG